MFKKAALFIFTAVSLVSIPAYAVEDESQDNQLACRDCNLACGCEEGNCGDNCEKPVKA